MLFLKGRTYLAFLAVSFLLAPASSIAAEHPLFIVQDHDPSYEDAQVSLITDSTNKIEAIRIVSGKSEFMRASLVNFQQGQSRKHLFVTVNNVAFNPVKGGKIQILFGKQNVDMDIVRQGSQWIAKTKGKRLKRVKVATKRLPFIGVPIGVRDDPKIEIASNQVETMMISLLPEAAAHTANPAGVNADRRVYEKIAMKVDAPGTSTGTSPTTDSGTKMTQPPGEIRIAL